MPLSYEAFVEEENNIWFSALDHNGLYHLNISSQTVSFLGRFPEEAVYQIRLYTSAVKYQNYLFFIPFNADEMGVYYIEKKQFFKIKFAVSSCVREKFWCYAVYKNKLFLLPHCYPAIIIFNMDTWEIEYKDDFLKLLMPFKINEEPYTADCIVENAIAYCSCACANVVIQINLESNEISLLSIPFNGVGYHGIYKNGELFWLAPRLRGGIVKYDSNSGEIQEFDQYPSEFDFSIIPFHTFYKYKNRLFLAPALSNLFIEVNEKTGEMHDIQELSMFLKEEKMPYSYSIDMTMACSLNKNIFSFFIGKNYKKIYFDFHTKKSKSYMLYGEDKYSIEDQLWIRNMILQKTTFFDENNEIELNRYLKLLLDDGLEKRDLPLKEYIVGNRIYECFR